MSKYLKNYLLYQLYIVSKSFKSTKYVRHSPPRYLEHHFHEKSDWHRTGKVSENASK